MRTPSPAARTGTRPAAVCEFLEGRQLLAADIVATELRGQLPADLVNGTRGRVNGLAVDLNNAGDAPVQAQVVIRLVASADDVVDAADPVLVEQTTRLRLTAGRGRRVPIRIRTVPDNVPQNTYRLFAVVDHTNVVPEDNEGNNTVGSSGSLAIGPPFVNLTATRVFVGPSLTSGRRGSLALTVLNAGNTDARGTANVSVTFTPVSPGGAASDVTVPVRVRVRARKEGLLRGRLNVPAGLTPGQYTITATLGTGVGFTDTNPADNTATVVVPVR